MEDLRESLSEALRKALQFETLEELKEYENRLRRHNELIESLIDDWDCALEKLEIDDSDQFCRRTLIRTLFVMIEGAVFALKQLVLEEHRIGKLELSPPAYAVLSEKSYALKESGVLRVLDNYPKLKANIKFTLPFYAHALGMAFEFDPPLDKEPGWGSLCRAIGKRNSLMHPKSQEDLVVSDRDLDDALNAASWFTEQLDELESMAFKALLQLLSEAETETSNTTMQSGSAAQETA